jgi:PadR family transcriptional regulator PadR
MGKDTNKVAAQMRKGFLELCVLTTISKKSCYASDILSELKKVDLIVVEGTLYPLLTRLKNDEYLAYRWEESTGGPPRKYYELTKEGVLLQESLKEDWDRLANSINTIINNK